MSDTSNTQSSPPANAQQWLKPSEALSRFAHPAPLTQTAQQRARQVRFGYRVGSFGFLVAAGVLSELLPASETYPIPNVAAAVRGYVNRQGALVPVWDLKQLLAIESIDAHDNASPAESILLLGRGAQRVGLVIDGLPRSLKKLERVASLPKFPDLLAPYVKDAWFEDDVLWCEFDYAAFFSAQTEAADR